MEHVFKRVIIPGIVGVVTLGTAVLGFSGTLKQRSNDISYSEWMKDISDDTSFRSISMPGSHDTMALTSIADLAGQCQTLSLEEQLNLGVRFLDIRLKLSSNWLTAVHGFIDQKCSYYRIIDVVLNFLIKHPSETIVMSIKEEADASKSTISFDEAIKSYMDDYNYYKGRTVPKTLGEVRGKIVLLSRYKGSTVGIDAYNEWQDSCSFTMASNDIYVQDTYKVTSAEQKENEIVSCFNESGHALKINFLSAYRTDTFPPSYAPSVAKDINPWINEEISKYSDRGIVLYDFVSEANMKAFFGK